MGEYTQVENEFGVVESEQIMLEFDKCSNRRWNYMFKVYILACN